MTRRDIFLLAGLLLLAALLRFAGLAEQGIFLFDEASFLSQTEKLLVHLRHLAGHLPELVTGRRSEPIVYRTFVHDMARPGHLLLLALAGARPTPGLFLMAGLGVAAVGALFLLARRLGEEIGLDRERAFFFASTAAFLLAISPAHLFHSRTLLAEIDAGLFLLLAFFALLDRERPHAHYIAGLLLGLALLTQSRLLPFLPLIIIWRALTLRSLGAAARLFAGVAAPILLVEIGYLLLNAGLDRLGEHSRFPSYTEQMVLRFRLDGGRLALNRPLFGPRYLLLVESLPAVLLAIAGAAIALRRRERTLSFLAGLALFTTVFASLMDQHRFTEVRYGRMLAPGIPLIALLGARSLVALHAFSRHGRAVALGLLLLVLLSRAPLIDEIVSMRSDYASLFRLVITRHGAPVVSDEASQAMALVSRDLIGTPTFHPDPPRAAIFFGREDWRYPLFQSLPETPSYHLPRPLLRPTVMTALEAVEAPDFALTPEAIKPVKVYIFAPDQ